MVEVGCIAGFSNSYEHEVKFAKENGFKFLQIWYDKNGLLFKEVEEQILMKE